MLTFGGQEAVGRGVLGLDGAEHRFLVWAKAMPRRPTRTGWCFWGLLRFFHAGLVVLLEHMFYYLGHNIEIGFLITLCAI